MDLIRRIISWLIGSLVSRVPSTNVNVYIDEGRRRSARVAVTTELGLQAMGEFGPVACQVNPIDVSLVGALVELPEDLEIQQGARFYLKLEDKSDSAVLLSEVRRKEGHKVGVVFPRHYRSKGKRAPKVLKRIVSGDVHEKGE